MNNIIEGCRCVIVNSEAGNNGIEVTIGKFLGKSRCVDGRRWAHGDIWATDKALNNSTDNLKQYHIPEYNLKRIDEDQASWEEIEKFAKWNPTRVTA